MKRLRIFFALPFVTCFVACVASCQLQRTQWSSRDATANSSADALSETSIRLSAEDADAAEPSVAASREDDTVYVAWVEHHADNKADVWLARIGVEGRMSGAPVRVNPNVGEATAWRGDAPTLAVGRDKTVYVGWARRLAAPSEQERHADDLCLSASRDGGKTFASPVRVNDNLQPAMNGMHSLALGENGRVYLAWLDERNLQLAAQMKPPRAMQSSVEFQKIHKDENHTGATQHKMEGNREVFTAFSEDGGRTFSRNQRLATNVCPCCKTTLAVAADGRVYASWRQVLPGDFRHIAITSSIDDGKSFSPPVIVSDDRWKIDGCPVSGAALYANADGGVRVLWYTAGDAGAQGLYSAESSDGGRTFAARRLFIAGQARGTPLLLQSTNNALLAVWESSENGAARPTSARIAEDGRANAITSMANAGELPAAAMLHERLFVAYIAKNKERRGIWLARMKIR